MGKVFINEETLVAISDAIRAKTGSTALIKPGDWAGELENIKGSGAYLWSRKGATDELTTGANGTKTMVTPNATIPSVEVEYSANRPTYNNTTQTWDFVGTRETIVNTDTNKPPLAVPYYLRLTSAPNVWYQVSAFNVGTMNTSGTVTKSITYSATLTAEAGSDVIGYSVADDVTAYPDGAMGADGYWYEGVGGFGPKIVSWADGTDEEIVAMVAAADRGEINLADYWSVGDTRSVNLPAMAGANDSESHDAQTVEFTLMHAGGYELNSAVESGRTTCSFIVGMKNILAEGGCINTGATNSGSWDGSLRRTWCNDVFYNAIPSTLRGMFKQFKVVTAGSYDGNSNKISIDYFTLPAVKEILGGNTASSAGYSETRFSNLTEFNALFPYDFYAETSNRAKATNWWTRSPVYNDKMNFCYCSNTGTGFGSQFASSKYGIAPVGCI